MRIVTGLRRRSRSLGLIFDELAGSPLMRLGAVLVATAIIAALVGPLVAPYDPTAIDLDVRLQAPSMAHWLGTDELGRDLLSRLLHGARISLAIGVSIVALSASVGTLIGAYAGLKGGWLDAAIMRATDVVLSLPGLVMAMAFTAALGPSLFNATLALAFVATPGMVRLARGQALTVRSEAYVEASQLYGAPSRHILLRHIIPNAAPALIVQATLSVGAIILAAAALSFLGLGAQPPTAEWGAMVANGRNYLTIHPAYPIAPGLAILVTATGFNLLGDGLNDALNPRREGRAK
ncbi:MAG: ABC transporter permease subunit [Pseudomonadota bacterium]